MTPTVPCRRCRRPLTDPNYAARGIGPKCGGRITVGRKPVTATTPTHLPVGARFEDDPDQLALDLEGCAA